MVIRQGRFGEFLACTGFPKCKTTRSLKEKKDEVDRKGKYGYSYKGKVAKKSKKRGFVAIGSRGKVGKKDKVEVA